MNRRNFINYIGRASDGLLIKQFSPMLANKKVKIYDNYIQGLQYRPSRNTYVSQQFQKWNP